MIRHLFKLIWNKKRKNFLLMTEILVSFIILFVLLSVVINNYREYVKPLGVKPDDVWVVSYGNPINSNKADSLTRFYETLQQSLKSVPGVQHVSFTTDNIPFSVFMNGTGLFYNNQVMVVNNYLADDNYNDALGVTLLEGKWFDKMDAVDKNKPIVINESLKKQLFGTENAVGKLIGDFDLMQNRELPSKLNVIGVVQDIKAKGDYKYIGNAIFNRIDTNSITNLNRILIRVEPGIGASQESELYKVITGLMKTKNISIEYLSDMRASMNKDSVIPMIILSIVAGFLIFNVALGLFGVTWYNINMRKGEIGVRRAMGANTGAISGQMLLESMVLATFSLIVGSFFAIQFPLLGVFNYAPATYFTALLIAIVFIYLLVAICALYPARKAASIYPAVALHEE
jgi:putative ABC transport system permease protein